MRAAVSRHLVAAALVARVAVVVLVYFTFVAAMLSVSLYII